MPSIYVKDAIKKLHGKDALAKVTDENGTVLVRAKDLRELMQLAEDSIGLKVETGRTFYWEVGDGWDRAYHGFKYHTESDVKDCLVVTVDGFITSRLKAQPVMPGQTIIDLKGTDTPETTRIKPKRRQIEVVLTDGTLATTTAEVFIGTLAVHRTFIDVDGATLAKGDGWVVTHLPTGKTIHGTFEKKPLALDFAGKIAERDVWGFVDTTEITPEVKTFVDACYAEVIR